MSEDCCYLTTTGRVSGEPREVEIWFALEGATLSLLSNSGTRAHWVRNLLAEPKVEVRIGSETYDGRARVVDDEQNIARVRELVAGKYDRLDSGWRRNGLPVAVDLGREPG